MAQSDRRQWVRRLVRRSTERNALLLVCLLLSALGTLTAAYPITAVVIPAAMMLPRRWIEITVTSAIGSALGATLLVVIFHQWGWDHVYARFPELVNDPRWTKVMHWVEGSGLVALFVIAATPLPQTPALIFFGMGRADYLSVYLVMLSGKLVKYGVLAWMAANFPERFRDGIAGFFGRNKGHKPNSDK